MKKNTKMGIVIIIIASVLTIVYFKNNRDFNNASLDVKTNSNKKITATKLKIEGNQKNNQIDLRSYEGKLNNLVTNIEDNSIKLIYSDVLKSQEILGYSITVFKDNEIINTSTSFDEIRLPKQKGEYKISVLIENKDHEKTQFAFIVELKIN